MGDIVFLLFLGAFICGIIFFGYKLCQLWYEKVYKKDKADQAFLAELKSNGIKPKITNATLRSASICVYAENYGQLWSYSPGFFVFYEAAQRKGDITARDLHWDEDTVTATFDVRDGNGHLLRSETVTLNVYRERL